MARPGRSNRTIGVRRRHLAIPNGDLDAIAGGEGAATGMEPLVQAIESAILGPEVARLARLPPGASAWLVALSWLTRDQECRFGNVAWRSPASGSDAPMPASGAESGPRRDFLRFLLRAITEEEQAQRETRNALKAQEAGLQQDANAFDWQLRRSYPGLPRCLDYHPIRPRIFLWRSSACARRPRSAWRRQPISREPT